MKLHCLLIILCLNISFFESCGSKKDQVSDVGNDDSAPKVDGARVFKINCALCHGEDGKLGANNSKDLTLCKMTLDERIVQITNGKGTMAPYGSLLTKAEIKAVAEYTMNFK